MCTVEITANREGGLCFSQAFTVFFYFYDYNNHLLWDVLPGHQIVLVCKILMLCVWIEICVFFLVSSDNGGGGDQDFDSRDSYMHAIPTPSSIR